MSILLLWLLATADSAFIGYRDAAGRSALIDKRLYYRRALLRGALLGQIAVGIAGIVAGAMLATASHPARLFETFDQVATRMLMVYVPYALILTIAFFIRAIPSVDIRSITSVVVFGPFTLIRPLVVLAGAIWGLLAAPTAGVTLLMALVVSLMLGMEYVLDRLRVRGFFYETLRTHCARAHSGRAHNDSLHCRQRLPGPEGRSHVRLVDSRRSDLDGDSERSERFVDSREQHRSDRGLCSRNAFRDHLRSSRTRDRGLVDRVSVLAVVSDLSNRRRTRCSVHDPAPARVSDEL